MGKQGAGPEPHTLHSPIVLPSSATGHGEIAVFAKLMENAESALGAGLAKKRTETFDEAS
jgi:hypothetical protein